MDITPANIALAVAALGVASSWGAIWQRLRSHEQADIERFQVHAVLLTEIREDVKQLLRGGQHYGQE